jgi:hypothetical protein
MRVALGGDRVGVFASPDGETRQYRVGIRSLPGGRSELLSLVEHHDPREAAKHALEIASSLGDMILLGARERIQELSHGEQLGTLRQMVVQVADHLGIERVLMDLDLAGAIPKILAERQTQDQIALVFFTALQRVVPVQVMSEAGGLRAIPDWQGTGVCHLARSVDPPAGYILLELTAHRWIRFRPREICVPPKVDPAVARAKALAIFTSTAQFLPKALGHGDGPMGRA